MATRSRSAKATPAKRGRHQASGPALPTPEVVDITTLRPHPRNYRTRTQDQLQHLQQSITAHGLYRNIVVAKDGTILAGHGVVEAAQQLHMTQVPVIRLDLEPHDPRAIKVLIGDNQIAQLAEVNDRLLTDMLQEVHTSNLVDLLGTGYNEEQLALLLMVTRPASEVADHDAAAEWVGLPAFDNTLPVVALVYCKTEADRDAFFEAIGAGPEHITRQNKGASIRWPLERKRVKATKVFMEQEPEPATGTRTRKRKDHADAGAPIPDLHSEPGPSNALHHSAPARSRRHAVPSGSRAAGGRSVSKRLRQ